MSSADDFVVVVRTLYAVLLVCARAWMTEGRSFATSPVIQPSEVPALTDIFMALGWDASGIPGSTCSAFSKLPPPSDDLVAITCTPSGFIASLRVQFNELYVGPNLPSSVATLTHLTSLKCDGTPCFIPDEISRVRGLQFLGAYLDFASTGTPLALPAGVFKLKRLTGLECSGAPCSLPESVEKLKQLKQVRFFFDGSSPRGLPAALWSLTNLSVLEATAWQGKGRKTLAPISNLKSLVLLNFANARVNDPLPGSFTQLRRLQSLNLGNTLGFFGKNVMPSWISAFPRLTSLDLPSNGLRGSVPAIRGTLLQNLNLYDNFLTGSIPQSLSKFVKLTSLNLGTNFLTGIIPPFIMKFPSLKYLDLSWNFLTGPVTKGPEKFELGVVAFNFLTGSYPCSGQLLVRGNCLQQGAACQDQEYNATQCAAFCGAGVGSPPPCGGRRTCTPSIRFNATGYPSWSWKIWWQETDNHLPLTFPRFTCV